MPEFVLQDDVHANVRALRTALGSATKPLSRDDLALLVIERHPAGRKPNGTSVQRWEEEGEPDVMSLAVLARLAGVSYESFALGKDHTSIMASLADLGPQRPRVLRPDPRPPNGDATTSTDEARKKGR